MNERMLRAAPRACAEFMGAFLDEPAPGAVGPAGAAAGLGGRAVWLVWRDEGDATLWDLMQRREFPYNLEPLLLGRELRLPRGRKRRLASVKLVLQQLLEDLEAAHSTGIGAHVPVHTCTNACTHCSRYLLYPSDAAAQ